MTGARSSCKDQHVSQPNKRNGRRCSAVHSHTKVLTPRCLLAIMPTTLSPTANQGAKGK